MRTSMKMFSIVTMKKQEIKDAEKHRLWNVGLFVDSKNKKNEIWIFYVVLISQWRWNLEVWFYWIHDNLVKLTKISFHIFCMFKSLLIGENPE